MQRHRHFILTVFLVAIIGAGSVGIVRVWHQRQRAAALAPRLPPLPDLGRWPAEFERQLRAATAEALAEENPTRALGALARLYFANGFDAPAQSVLAILREREPSNALWPYLIAESSRRTGHSAKVEPALQETVRLAPGYFPARVRLGDALAQRGSLDAARECYTRARALAPLEVTVAYASIAFEARHGNPGYPRSELTALVREHPGIAQLHLLLAELLAAGGDETGAQRQRHLAASADRELDTTDPWIDELMPLCFDASRVTLRAIAAYRERRLDDAEKLLRQALTLSPGDPTLHDALAHVYELLHRPADARAILEKAIVACPDDPMMPVRLARLLSREQNHEQAIALLRTALQRWPADAGLHGALGFSLRDAGKNSDAMPELREAVRLDPAFVEAHYQLGFCLLALGQRDAARAEVEKALAMRPDYTDALLFLASLALESGDVAAAEQHITRLQTLQPDEPGVRLLFATLQLLKGTADREAGRLAEAEQKFQAGLAAAPDFAPLLLESGVLAAQRGQYAAARDAFERHVRVEPDDSRAYVALGKILLALEQPAEARQVLTRGLAVAQKAGARSQIEECERLLKR